MQEEAIDRLRAAGLPTPAVDARRMVEEASGHEGAAYHAALDDPVTRRGLAHFDAMLARRLTGEPLQYVLGVWSFRAIDVLVDRRVLIPRPETEVVAGQALDELRRRPSPATVAVDLGTGSGAIALSLAYEQPGVQVWATDASAAALDVARANLAGLGSAAARVRLVEGDWFAALPEELAGTIDLIVSNPPYIAEGEELPPEVRDWEPTGALFAGPTGLEALTVLVDEAPRWLARGGVLVVELAPHQADAIAARARSGGFARSAVGVDLADRKRFVVARTANS